MITGIRPDNQFIEALRRYNPSLSVQLIRNPDDSQKLCWRVMIKVGAGRYPVMVWPYLHLSSMAIIAQLQEMDTFRRFKHTQHMLSHMDSHMQRKEEKYQEEVNEVNKERRKFMNEDRAYDLLDTMVALNKIQKRR